MIDSPTDYSYNDFLRFKLEQSYDINEAKKSDPEKPFSPVYAELDLFPGKYIALDADALYSVYDLTVLSHNLAATKIQVKSIDSLTLAEAKGQVTEFASLASFRVAGQLVDASSAVFLRGAAANVVDGAVVEVRGTVGTGGVLKATSIKVDDN